MRLYRKTMAVAALALAGAFVSAGASAQEFKPEQTLKMRQGLMLATKAEFGPIGAFLQGKGDLPADTAARAEALGALFKISPIAWTKGGEKIKDSETKAEAFTSPDFAKGWETAAAAAAKLADAAKGGDAAAIKTAAMGVGKACKGCHDQFKED